MSNLLQKSRNVSAFSKFTNSSIRKLANYTIYGKKTQQIITLSYGHTASSSGEGYMVECTCDYAEATLLSTMGGMDKDKDKDNIIHYIGQ